MLHNDKSNVALQEPSRESPPMVSWPVALLWWSWGNAWPHGRGDSAGDFTALSQAPKPASSARKWPRSGSLRS